MAAANTDKFRKMKSQFSTTLASGITDSDTTIACNSLAGVPTGTAVTITIDRVDANGTATPDKQERVVGVVSTNSLTNCLRNVDGDTAQVHSAGAVVEMIWDADTWNDALDGILAEHSQAGAHTVDTISEKTAGAGVTIDGLKVKDGIVQDLGYGSYNFLINGGFDVWQRGTSFTSATNPVNSDDNYLADRWILLSDGNDIADVSRSTTAPTGSSYSLLADVETANKKFGFIQILEGIDTKKLAGGGVSLGLKVKTDSGKVVENVRVALLEWTGPVDTVTSDVVAAWAVEGTNPTLAANWGYANTPVDNAVGTDWTEIKIEAQDIDTSTTNLAVFIWVDDTDCAAGDFLYISQVRLAKGDKDLGYTGRSYAEELAMCQRYSLVFMYNESYSQIGDGSAPTTTDLDISISLPTSMRVKPVIAVSSVTHFLIGHSGMSASFTGIQAAANNRLSENSFSTRLTGSSGLTQFRPGALIFNTTAGSWLELNSEL